MPVSITTTKEERIAKLVAELKDAGLVITHLNVDYETFPTRSFGDGYGQRELLGRRRVRAELEVIGPSPEETYEMLLLWSRGGY